MYARPMRPGAWLVAACPLSCATALVASVILLAPSDVSAQERSGRSFVTSEILDPFPRASRRDLPQLTEILVEIIDPFEDAPRAADTRTSTEILDPFRARRAILCEILDPWAS